MVGQQWSPGDEDPQVTCIGAGIIAVARVQHVVGRTIILATRIGSGIWNIIRRQFAALTGLFRVGR